MAVSNREISRWGADESRRLKGMRPEKAFHFPPDFLGLQR